jgi:hypothetical protein
VVGVVVGRLAAAEAPESRRGEGLDLWLPWAAEALYVPTPDWQATRLVFLRDSPAKSRSQLAQNLFPLKDSSFHHWDWPLPILLTALGLLAMPAVD